ncbi:MAG: hypothetical protein H0U60_03175 [Blastocatellia bacterium]|nr:hypothetical protein [Blastocatellia bacterium]
MLSLPRAIDVSSVKMLVDDRPKEGWEGNSSSEWRGQEMGDDGICRKCASE